MDSEEIETIHQALGQFGLGQEEIAVYRAVLESGARPATVIATLADLKRGQTYNILKKLIELGIVQEFFKSGVRQFTCSPPSILPALLAQQIEEIEDKKKRLEKIVPLLQQLQYPASIAPKFQVFRGISGIKEIYKEILKSSDCEIQAIIDVEYDPIFSEGDNFRWINSFIEKRSSRNLWWHGIINKSPGSDQAVSRRRSDKRMAKMITGAELPMSVQVCEAKVAIFSYEDRLGFLLENEKLAATLKGMHSALWRALPEYQVSSCS